MKGKVLRVILVVCGNKRNITAVGNRHRAFARDKGRVIGEGNIILARAKLPQLVSCLAAIIVSGS